MSLGEDYPGLDATALADLVRRRQVGPAELVEAAIARLEQVEPHLAGMTEWALDQARRAAREPVGGPFAGVPFLLKDNMHVAAGLPYHNGSRIWRGWVPPRDSEMVRRFRAAGLIILGSTKVPELSLTPVTEPRHLGPARNPWALDRTAGGSSGGSAAHVAARSVPMAHATDGGGSIRIPASCCGLFGLKPSRGRTPNGPYLGEGWHGAAVGHVLTRSVRDSARLLDAVAGPDPGAPCALARPGQSFAAAAARPPERLRIAWSSQAPNGAPVDPECRQAVEDAAGLCAALGHAVVEAAPRIPDAYFDWFLTVFLAAVAQEFTFAEETTGHRARRAEVEESTWLCRALGHGFSAAELSLALERLHRTSRRIASFFDSCDVLLTPTLASPPVRHGDLRSRGLDAVLEALAARLGVGRYLRYGPLLRQAAERAFRFIPFTPVWNMTGQPAASLPLHWTPDGLPVGVQAVGRVGEEATLLALAAELEQAHPWSHRLPPLGAASA
ncbi:Amidase [Methylobacterium sp. 4-46]|uniref:amidase n=1 Tax=unclassified Methylobacterium TaxID=2615210 RepID=UPI000152D7B5|nr:MULTISPECIES: amidase family protein [Methylobacterium]ACA15117.1 Amidase [Methylobacterium sp. 4-46]WFT80850.1 amidase family protein [Methylobacterium nodulans]